MKAEGRTWGGDWLEADLVEALVKEDRWEAGLVWVDDLVVGLVWVDDLVAALALEHGFEKELYGCRLEGGFLMC